MALSTRCPHCQTAFRVAADQLKLRSGLVRCGSCKQIFNGIEHLIPQGSNEAETPKPAGVSTTAIPAVAAASPAPVPIPEPLSATAAAPLAPPPSIPASIAEPVPAVAPAPVAETHTESISALDFVPLETAEMEAEAKAEPPEPAPASDSQIDSPLPTSAAKQEEAPHPATAIEESEEEPEKESATALPAPPTVPLTAPAESATDANLEAAREIEEPAVELEAAASDSAPPATTPTISADVAPLAPEAEDHHAPEGFDDEDDEEPVETAKTPTAPLPIPSKAAIKPAAVVHEEEISNAEEEDTDEDEREAYEPGFVVRDKRRQRFRRMSRIFMSLCSLLLLAGLVGQGAYVFRNQLAAQYPQTKPYLAELCQYAGCQVKLPAQIDMVSIESSELQAAATNKNVFTLTVLLRNRSAVAQAWPDIELTLNDANEKPVARRILKPRDYLASVPDGAKGLAGNSEQAVKLNFELDQLKASGYRVYLFYS